MNEEYKNTKCYKNLNAEQKKFFDILVNTYGEDLNKGCPIGDVLYTAHDFDKHCNNIFKIISDIIINNEDKVFSEKEFFILCISVLFHDISMSVYINWDRNKHSLQSANYLNEQSKDVNTLINQAIKKALLSKNDIDIIRSIITAHSDIKDGSVDDKQNGIYNPKLSFDMANNINGKTLAAILRLADELDITTDRLGSENFSLQLDEYIEEEKESILHWNRLHYFSRIKIDDTNVTILQLHCDDEYINASGNAENISNDIVNVINKIKKELDSLNKEVFTKPKNKLLSFRINEIKVISSIREINEKFNFNINEYPRRVNPEKIKKEENSKKSVLADDNPKIICNETSQKLYNHIVKNKLFKDGHYILTENYCAMDWIDVNDIIETKKIFDLLVQKIVNEISKFPNFKDIIILGLDFSGSIIASQVSLLLQLPFQVIIPAKSQYQHTNQDIKINIPDNKKIILISDAISTYNTISSVINNYNIKERIEKIFCILYRKPLLLNNESIDNNDNDYLKEITLCLNKDFSMNIVKKENCRHKDSESCIANNK